jgi:hypothetical protein
VELRRELRKVSSKADRNRAEAFVSKPSPADAWIGFIIGDGKLRYAPEQILETYYALSISHGIVLTFDLQEVANPGYNADRGPVAIGSIRVHWDH